jgi:predicted aminopeptidase
MEAPLRCISRKRAVVLFVLFAPAVLLGLAAALSAEVRFVLRSGWEEARILCARRSIAAAIADPATPPQRRAQLELVLAARRFAARDLGLRAGSTYTTFADIGEGPLLHVLSASPRTRLDAYRWRYPIVGSIPYKGFFDEAAARDEQRRLERLGYDTYLRPSGAFSTLGWLPDPLLSTALDGDPAELVATVIHEIAHNTLWVPGDAPFNESYAELVGYHGAAAFFTARGDARTAERCEALWRDEKRLARLYAALEQGLDDLYASGLSERETLARREEIFARAQAVLAGPLDRSLEVWSGRSLARRPLNNARVIAHRIYTTGYDPMERMVALAGGDLRAGIRMIARSVRRNPALPALDAVALAVRRRGVYIDASWTISQDPPARRSTRSVSPSAVLRSASPG